MSKISLSPSPTGSAVYTIASPAGSTDRTLNLPDAAGTVALTTDIPAAYTDTDALDLFNASGSAPVFACRAFVNFNGTGTPAIRASGNVSSITDNNTGDYTVNFTTAMPDENYSANLSASREPSSGGGAFCQNIATNDATGLAVAPTTSAIRVAINGGSGLGGRDVAFICVSVFR